MSFKTNSLLLGFYICTLFSLSAAVEVYDDMYSSDQLYLITDAKSSIEEVRTANFLPLESFPNIQERQPQAAVWIKQSFRLEEQSELVFDFIRKDFVNLYFFLEDSLLNEYKTGFLLPASQKKMGRWNAIDLVLEPEKTYTLYFKIVNTVNDPDIKILIHERGEWREHLLFGIIKDVAFLSVILILAIYALLIYFQNKILAYLHFSLYLLSIFIFYLYILDILRDFFLKDDTQLTLYCVSVALLSPFFYLKFMQDFLNTKKLLPKWNRSFSLAGKGNVLLFFGILAYYFVTQDYYLLVDTVRYCLFINVFIGILLISLLWQKRNLLVRYFIIGSAIMLAGTLMDLIVWTTSSSLGDIARIGFIAEIGFFSMGLGRKSQIAEKERELAQKSYIDQMEINEKLIEDQKVKLEIKVQHRTRELSIAKEEAENSARAKQEFLSVMSHEIRTPMNAIVGLTHMLSPKNEDPEDDENLKTLRYAVENLMLLINNILDYNKISMGGVELEKVNFNLFTILNSVSHLFKSKADSKGLDFLIDIDSNLPEIVNGDPFRLSQVLNNFLSNAIKFTDTGSIRMKATALDREEKHVNVEFEILDTGVGIPSEKHQAIFESFTQAGPDMARKYGGTGLGLSISKDLITLMGGEINLESEVGKGTSFSCTVGFEIPKLAKDIVSLGNGNSDFKNTELGDLSVLIVDDNILNRVILQKFMEMWNVKYDSSENGLQAMKKLKEERFDLVLLDLQMPEMDGYEVAEEMAKDESLRHIPIIAISADTISNIYDKVIASGMDDFITKPFNPAELKSKIYRHTAKIK